MRFVVWRRTEEACKAMLSFVDDLVEVSKNSDNADHVLSTVMCLSNLTAFEDLHADIRAKGLVDYFSHLHESTKDADVLREVAQSMAELGEQVKSRADTLDKGKRKESKKQKQKQKEEDEDKEDEDEERKKAKEDLKAQIKNLVDRLEREKNELELEKVTHELGHILSHKCAIGSLHT
jgi:hypothetical protein